MHFLHADDNAVIRPLIARILTGAGHRVNSVESGEELLRQLALARYDAVITDNSMDPRGKTGVEVLQAIRADPRLRDLPVLVLSGDADEIKDSVEALGSAVASKASAREELFAWIEKIKPPA